MIHVVLSYVLLTLIGISAFWYIKSFRAWTQRLKDPVLDAMSIKQREAYMHGAEYGALRSAVRKSIYTTTILTVLFYVAMHLPF